MDHRDQPVRQVLTVLVRKDPQGQMDHQVRVSKDLLVHLALVLKVLKDRLDQYKVFKDLKVFLGKVLKVELEELDLREFKASKVYKVTKVQLVELV